MFSYSKQTCLQPLTNPSRDSQAWKTYFYLDEGAARGTEWDNRRRIRCTVALHWEWLQHHPLYRRQSNLAVMCKDTYLPGEDFSSISVKKKWKWMLTAACHCFIFWASDLNRETLLKRKKEAEKSPDWKINFWLIVNVITQRRGRFAMFMLWLPSGSVAFNLCPLFTGNRKVYFNDMF